MHQQLVESRTETFPILFFGRAVSSSPRTQSLQIGIQIDSLLPLKSHSITFLIGIDTTLNDLYAEFDEAVEVYEALPARTPHQHFNLIYAEQTPQLQRQQAELLQELEIESDSDVFHDNPPMPL